MAIIERSDILESTPNIESEIIQGVVQGSKVLGLMTRLPDMVKSKEKMPVLNMLPEAYWVSGDTGLKQTTSMAWKNKYIYAEEIAVVVPIPENVLADSDYDIIGQAQPRIIEAIYKKIDEAVILGKNKPAQFRDGLIPSIISYGFDVAPSTDNLYTQISKAMGKVETSNYEPNGLLGGLELKQVFREGLLDTTNQPLANSEVTQMPRNFVNNGAWDKTKAKFIVGDFKQAVYSFRSSIEFKLFDSGVVQDSNGNIIYNLMQQDMVALRVTVRFGWEIPNPINSEVPGEESRFPFALVQPASEPTTYTITFTVTDTSSTAVANAYITCGGNVKKTNASGQAVFKVFGSNDYLYEVSKKGSESKYGKATVATSNVTVAVENF